MFVRCVLSFRGRLKYLSATLVKCLLKILAMSLSFVYVLLLYVIDTMVLEFAGLLPSSLNNLDSILGLFLLVSIDFE